MRPEATHEDPVRSTIYKIVVIFLKALSFASLRKDGQVGKKRLKIKLDSMLDV